MSDRLNAVIVRGPGSSRTFLSPGPPSSHPSVPERIIHYVSSPGDSGKLSLQNSVFHLIEKDGTRWQFNNELLLAYVQDSNGNRVTCGYTGRRLTSLTDSSGRQLLLQYHGAGLLSQVIDPLGPGAADDRITTYEYDGAGEHLIRVTAPGARVTTYAYHTAGLPQRLHALSGATRPDLTQDSFAYDEQGRLIETSRNCCDGAQKVTYAYDSVGTVSVTDATGRLTVLFYGQGGQLAQVIDGEDRRVAFAYDNAGQLAQLTGPGGERYGYSHDNLGNLVEIEDPLHQVSNFAYETKFNRLAQVRDARANGLKYDYETRGNLSAITYADNTLELFDYDTRGNVVTSTNRRGGAIDYTYNSAGQLTSKDYAATPGLDFEYTYDVVGNLTSAHDSHGTTKLAYEPNTDRLTRIEYPGGKWFELQYDAAGRRTRRTDQDGQITTYEYDALGRLDMMKDGDGNIIVDYEFDEAGRLRRKTLGNGVFTTYAYNQAGQILELVNRKPDNSVLSSFSYTYDSSGGRNSMTTLAGTETYTYDLLGQLTSVTYPDGRVVIYTYDPAGNRTQVTDNGVITPYAANALNQYTTAGAAAFEYDLDGNLIRKTEGGMTTEYEYDSENRLIRVVTPTDTWTNEYDAFGNRVVATHNGQTTRYVIDPTGLGNVAAEYDGGGSLIARYEHGFGLLARTDAAGDPAFYTFSAIGHTSELTGPSGAVANAYAYDPFGLSLAKTETIPNPFEFVGEFGVMNEGNGLELMRARFYDSMSGRFLSTDPSGLDVSLNFYSYVKNSPTRAIDPSGLRRSIGDWLGNVHDRTDAINEIDDAIDRGDTDGINDSIDRLNDANRRIHDGAFDGIMDLWDKFGNWTSPPDKLDDAYDLLKDLFDTAREARLFETTDDPAPDQTYEHDQRDSNVVRSRDPNDKLGPSGYGSAGYLPAGGVMAYQIRFENQPIATAPAQRVTATDTLDPNLDLSTFELTQIAFANQFIDIPPGLNHYSTQLPVRVQNGELFPGPNISFLTHEPCPSCLVVDVDAMFDIPTRTLSLTLTALDPLTGWFPEDPLVGLLYPNNETRRGEGSISFLVRSEPNLPSGTRIENKASIVFDFNDPINTPLVFNTLDAAPPTSQVQSLPAQAGRLVLIQWSGADDPGGSGIAAFDIYVSDNDGPFTLWLDRTQDTSGEFTGTSGHNYAFFSVARDNAGNEEPPPIAPDAQTVIVGEDTTPPTIICPPAPTVAVGGDCQAEVPNILDDVTTSDDVTPHDALTLTQSPDAGTIIRLGITTVTVTVTDEAGNSATCSVGLTVVDTTPPTLNCPTPQVISADDRCTAIVPNLISQVTALDNCTAADSLSVRQDPPAGAVVPLGATIVTFSATDAAGNVGSCTATLTVADGTPPEITSCPADLTVPAGADCQAAVPDVLTDITASDNCTPAGSLTLTQSPAAGTLVGLGITTTTVTATDAAGNSGTCTTTLTVVDETPPTITLVGADPIVIECAAPFADPGATADDICGGIVAVSSSGAVDPSTPGSYTITYSVTDPSGNTAAATRTVNVVDTIPPVIIVNGASPLAVPCQTPFTDPGATASDACAGNVPVTVSGGVDVNTPGDYTRTYSVTDPSGNMTTTMRTVTVLGPCPACVLICPADLTVSSEAGECSAIVNYPPPVAIDECVVPVTIVCNPPSGSVFPVGSTTVNCTATDGEGRVATCTFTVTVEDRESWVLTCPPAITVQCLSDVSPPDFAGGSVTDNCDPNPVVAHLSDVTTGSNPTLITRTYQVTDANGNPATCTQIITVLGLAGDFNGDCCVDLNDLDVLLSRVRTRSTDLNYDLNDDAKVDVSDARSLVLLFTNPGGASCDQQE